MMKKYLCLLTFSMLISMHCLSQVNIIFDTDFGGDADDLGALAMLHNFIDTKECNLLAIVSWSTEKSVIPALDAVNRFYNHEDIPLGIRHQGEWYESDWNYNKAIADKLPHELTNNDATEATTLYRQLLASHKDKSITIVTVGPLANIKNLIESGPDDLSPFTGKELIEKKVNRFVVMGGEFPVGKGEWNFNGDMENVTKFVFEHVKVPIIFSGYEIGVIIKTGEVFNTIDKNHPLYLGFKHFSEHAPWIKEKYKGEILDNATYDQTAVLYAVRGGEGKWWTRHTGGYCKIDTFGNNEWIDGKETNQSYLKLLVKPEEMATLIESLMLGK